MNACSFFRGRLIPYYFSLAALFSVGCSSGGADLYPHDGVCQALLVACDGKCVNPQNDSGHCGASGSCLGTTAGAVCARDHVCVAGVCTPGCAAGQLKCDGHCVDPLTSAEHCGASADCQGVSAGVSCQPVTGRCAAMVTQSCQGGHCINKCPHDKKSFTFTGYLEPFTLPSCVLEITVKAWGAQGGGKGGLGAAVEGTVCVKPGTMLSVVVGEQPPAAPYPSGGGGGSFVAIGTTPLFVAGGGGGGYAGGVGGAASMLATTGTGAGGKAYNDGGGGGGFTGDGMGSAGSGGHSFQNGANGGIEFPAGSMNSSRGGFGGGGGASQSTTFSSGGGGGFDGGNCGGGSSSTGGTSFISPNAATTTFTAGIRSGHGAVEVSY